MKELSIKEKARRYDEAIWKAKELKNNPFAGYGGTDLLSALFPELKESEDDKIKSCIGMILTDAPENRFNDFNTSLKECLAWLEKQDSQILANSAKTCKDERKSIWHNEDEEPKRGSLILLIMQSGTPIVAKIIEPNHTFNHGERWAYIDDLLEKQGEQKLVDFSDLRTWKYIIDAVLTEIGGIGQYLDSPLTEEAAKKLQKRFGNIEQKPAVCDRKIHQGGKNNPYDMSMSEAEAYTSKRGFDIPWNDCDVFVDERYITQTVGNILRWADDNPKQKSTTLELKEGCWYLCIEDYQPRADYTEFYQGEKYHCEKDGVMGKWCIKHPEKYFRECKKPADKVEPKFMVGDIISNGISEVKIVSIDKNYYIVTNDEIENDANVCNWVVYFKNQDDWKLVEQKSTWCKEDEAMLNDIISDAEQWEDLDDVQINWLKSLKDRVQPQNFIITDEELAQAKKDAYNDALDKIEYHSGEPTFDDGWSSAILYLKKRNAQFQLQWKPSDEQMDALETAVSSLQSTALESLYNKLKKL